MNLSEENIVENLKMERLHLRIIDDTIDVLYRPNHTYLTFLPYNQDGLNKLKEILEYSREEFIIYLSYCKHFPNFNKDMIESIKNGKLEEWYKLAWKSQTDKILKELNLENPIEEPIFSEEILKYK